MPPKAGYCLNETGEDWRWKASNEPSPSLPWGWERASELRNPRVLSSPALFTFPG